MKYFRNCFTPVLVICAAMGLSAKTALAFQTLDQVNNIQVIVNVGSTPAPTPPPAAMASVGQQASFNVQPGTLQSDFTVAPRKVVLSGTPGQTVVTNSCDITWVRHSVDQGATFKIGWLRAFVDFHTGNSFPGESGYIGLFPTGGSRYQWENPVWADDGGTFAFWAIGNGTSCVQLKITIPVGTPSGSYQNELSLLSYVIGRTHIPSPSPSPTPTPTVAPTPTATPAPTPTPLVAASYLYAAAFANNQHQLLAFNPSANGNAAPSFIMTNQSPLLGNEQDVAGLPDGSIVIADGSSNDLYIAPATAHGVTPPTALISNSLFEDPCSVGTDGAGDIWVLQCSGNFWAQAAIMEFDHGTVGNVAATSQIPAGYGLPNPAPKDIAVDPNGNLYVAEYDGSPSHGFVAIFAKGANGAAATPLSTIAGTTTNIGRSDSISVDRAGDIFVLSDDNLDYGVTYPSAPNPALPTNPRILVFAPGSNGNVAPVRTIQGTLTGLQGPMRIRADTNGGIYVADYASGSILYFAPGANGNVPPMRAISGSNTGFGPSNLEFASI